MAETVRLMMGDCVERMKEVGDGSVDAVITSPPYDKLRFYRSGDTFNFDGLASELNRVLADGGIVVWVVGDQTINGSESGTSFRQALGFKDIGFRLHDTMIYAKSNPAPTNHNRYEQAFEYMFVFSKGKPKTVNKITEPCKNAGRKSGGTIRKNLKDSVEKSGNGKPYKDRKPLTNIWTYGVGAERVPDHPAPFPLQLATDHIVSWTEERDLVLDPFMGSGTTGAACINTNRNFVGIERDPAYFAIAQSRIAAARSATPLLSAAQ